MDSNNIENELRPLKGQNALVTGSARGIGRAIALRLAQLGANVAVNYLSSEKEALDIVQEINNYNVHALTIKADVSQPEEAEKLVDYITKEWNGIDILVNNAGIRRDNLLMTMGYEEWDKVIDTNLKGTFICSKLCMRNMITKHRGSIVSIVSNSGVTGVMGQTNYSASKGGIIAFTKSLAREVGRFGIRVNAVAPGLIETDMTSSLDSKIKTEMRKNIALNRIGKPEEVADAVAFLVSDRASFITGHTLMVNGGDVI